MTTKVTMDDGTTLELGDKMMMINGFQQAVDIETGYAHECPIEECTLTRWLMGGFTGRKIVGGIVDFGGGITSEFELSYLGLGVWTTKGDSEFYTWKNQ